MNVRSGVRVAAEVERIDSLRSPISGANAFGKDRRAQQVDRLAGEIMA